MGKQAKTLVEKMRTGAKTGENIGVLPQKGGSSQHAHPFHRGWPDALFCT